MVYFKKKKRAWKSIILKKLIADARTNLIEIMASGSISCGPWRAGTTAEVWGILCWATLYTCRQTAPTMMS
jgi:hypothetical protein